VALATPLGALSCSDPAAQDARPTGAQPVASPPTTPTIPATPGDGEPGVLLSSTPIDGPSHPSGARAWHVAYRIRDVRGAPAVATALLVVPPESASATTRPRPLVAWAHPTRGVADRCAPANEGPDAIPLLADLLGNGWAVVAPDYEGLGSPGPHPYLVGASEGDSILWAATAALTVDHAGIGPESPVALWGFSQGGHAAAFAAERAATVAPNLRLAGVALAAPVTDVASFAARAERRDDQRGVLVTIVAAYAAAYPELDATAVLTTAALDRSTMLESDCIGDVVEAFGPPHADVATVAVAAEPGFAARLAENRAGSVAAPLPALVVQGDADDTVDPADTAAFVARWCDLGTPVTFIERPGADHGDDVTDVVVPWLDEVFSGRPTRSTCP
jgi:alpha-beta hydrolase superfamily lysophospholipase